jgi:E3 ubiquitin-protein ligase EDD1
MSATSIRCSVATESGRIATWMDELLGHAGSKLEHAATTYPEFNVDKIISIHTCTLYTVVRTESGELFWWGVLPYGQRKRLWDKYKTKTKKPDKTEKVRTTSSSSMSSGGANLTSGTQSAANEITVGAQVCMKTCPMYQAGAIGFTIYNGVPKVGQLLEAAWDLNLTNSCRFKLISMPVTSTPPPTISSFSEIKDLTKAQATGGAVSSVPSGITPLATLVTGVAPAGPTASPSNTSGAVSGGATGTTNQTSTSSSSTKSTGSNSGSNKETADRLDMPPPPSPASSTCSDTGSVSNKRQKRMQPKDEPEPKKDEETWLLK